MEITCQQRRDCSNVSLNPKVDDQVFLSLWTQVLNARLGQPSYADTWGIPPGLK
jgi:hypothetical protein